MVFCAVSCCIASCVEGIGYDTFVAFDAVLISRHSCVVIFAAAELHFFDETRGEDGFCEDDFAMPGYRVD